MGRITAEVDNETGLKLPEACPLHKHKVTFEFNSSYFKHRVGTDDEYEDGQQRESWDYTVPEGKVIDYVSNGISSGGYGNVKIYSNQISALSSHDTTVIVYLRDPDWVYSYTYSRTSGLPLYTDWTAKDLGYTITYTDYYSDKVWTSYTKSESGGTSSGTLSIGENLTGEQITHRTSGYDYNDYVYQKPKPEDPENS